jgi:hypothetical protein
LILTFLKSICYLKRNLQHVVNTRNLNDLNSVVLHQQLSKYPHRGLEAFENGLKELSNLHSAVSETSTCLELKQRGCSEKYSDIGLKLAPSSQLL